MHAGAVGQFNGSWHVLVDFLADLVAGGRFFAGHSFLSVLERISRKLKQARIAWLLDVIDLVKDVCPLAG